MGTRQFVVVATTMTILRVIVAACVLVLLWEGVPVAWREYNIRTSRQVPRARFVVDERVHAISADYPTIMGRVVTEAHDELAEGAAGPALELAWQQSSLRATIEYASRNFLVRMFSPKDIQEHVLLYAVLAAIAWAASHYGVAAFKAHTYRLNMETVMAAAAASRGGHMVPSSKIPAGCGDD